MGHGTFPHLEPFPDANAPRRDVHHHHDQRRQHQCRNQKPGQEIVKRQQEHIEAHLPIEDRIHGAKRLFVEVPQQNRPLAGADVAQDENQYGRDEHLGFPGLQYAAGFVVNPYRTLCQASRNPQVHPHDNCRDRAENHARSEAGANDTPEHRIVFQASEPQPVGIVRYQETDSEKPANQHGKHDPSPRTPIHNFSFSEYTTKR